MRCYPGRSSVVNYIVRVRKKQKAHSAFLCSLVTHRTLYNAHDNATYVRCGLCAAPPPPAASRRGRARPRPSASRPPGRARAPRALASLLTTRVYVYIRNYTYYGVNKAVNKAVCTAPYPAIHPRARFRNSKFGTELVLCHMAIHGSSRMISLNKQKGRCPTTVGGTVHTPHGALGGSLTLTRDTVTR